MGDTPRCPKTENGTHFWVTYVERNPYRRGLECKRCGHREPAKEPEHDRKTRAMFRRLYWEGAR
ncbi:MAG: hypothetical protein GY769_07830 [bacterium]|nr:hypothetical protein [bacterium]